MGAVLKAAASACRRTAVETGKYRPSATGGDVDSDSEDYLDDPLPALADSSSDEEDHRRNAINSEIRKAVILASVPRTPLQYTRPSEPDTPPELNEHDAL